MADLLALTATISAILSKLVQEKHKSQHPNDAGGSSQVRGSKSKFQIVLETSRQKFQVWRKTWVEDVSHPTISAGELWGEPGWIGIQTLLANVQETAHRIESELARRDDGRTHFSWQRALRGSLTRKNHALTVKSPPLLDHAIQLSKSIDELWTYSEVAFDSLHGLFAHQMVPPWLERLLAISLHARTGALALYSACSESKADYSLEVDLFGENLGIRSVFHRRSPFLSTMPLELLYHLFAQDRVIPVNVSEITIETMSKPGEQDVSSSGIVEHDIKITDLAANESWPSLKSGLYSIKSHTEYATSYFRIARPPVAAQLDGETQSLAQLLDKAQIGSALEPEGPLSQETKIELAFKVVECGFFLLGTPWLASLSSKWLRRIKRKGRTSFVLEVQTLNLEDLYFEDPNALSEHSHLFSIGVVLVEIALEERNPSSIKDPELRKSILPLVERSMGSLYSGATAFCLQDRRSAPRFERLEKYKNPKETGWTSYLTELLEDYHAQVYSR